MGQLLGLMNQYSPLVSGLANVAMAVGVFFVWKQVSLMKRQMGDDHERSRRQTVIDVMQSWNRDVGPATAAAQKLVAMLSEDACRTLANIRPTRIPKDAASLAHAALEGRLAPDQLSAPNADLELDVAQTAHLRFLVVEYLNALEIALSAWKLGIADAQFMEAQFSFLLDRSTTDATLANFRAILGVSDGFPSLREFLAHVQVGGQGGTPREQLGMERGARP